MTRTRLRIVATTATAACTVLTLALTGGPAAAHAPATPGRHGTRPAPVDPGAATGSRARANAQPAAAHTVPNELLKEQFAAGEDEGVEAPTVSALCQQYIGQPNPYRNPAPNVDAIQGDTIVPVGSQQGCSSAQNETTIAVNPGNPRNVVAASNDYRLFNSR